MEDTEARAAITTLQAKLQELRNELLRRGKPRSSLPNPEKFNGQSYKFDTWLPSIKAKLRVDSEAIGDSIAQFYYVYLNLDSHVQAMVLPQLAQAEEAQIWNYKSILDQLCRVNDNPNKVQEAEDKLLSIKQGTDSLHAYMAKFKRVLYKARGHDWPNVNKISTFRNGLHPAIRGRLSQQLNLPRTYPDFIKIVQQLASRSSGGPSTYPSSAEQKTSQPYHKSDAIDLNQVEINTIRPTTPPRARTTSRSTSP
jgi:hypothetical protein